ncbi:heme peroxidase [Ilyonectria destructans]|nr:heme peroxidase [Ilyonectria destructans]
MERFIQLATSLPDGSETQVKLTGTLIKGLWDSLQHPPLSYLGDGYEYRTADGSNNNILHPKLGMAGTPYARSVTPLTPGRPYPDPGEVFDKLLARQGPPKEQPSKVSSMLFYMATIIIHDLFRTGDDTKKVPNPDFSISSTSSYLDLSPLYGNNVQEQEAVRTMKDGMLKPDTFSEHRLLGFPPGVCAFLITFNRFHNYVAGELKRINEGGRFGPNPRLSKEDAEREIDKDLFNTARLVTCGLYVNIILSDYTRTILNLNYAPDSSWVLDPRESFSQVFDKGDFPVSTGNQVSVEFNLIYRWHSNVSAKDEKWSQDFFQKLFPGQDVSKLPLRDFLTGLSNWREDIMAQEPESRTFAGLERDSSGYFDTQALAKLIAESTHDVSAAFGAHQVPAVLKPVVMLGISQARGWHVGTLNELRKFMDLKPHKSFKDINPDPETQEAMKALYKEPDFVEMYPGVLFEHAKQPVYPGSGLCAGFTTIRAILSDAVTLVRGDRFYTLDWTSATMTDWGFDIIKRDKPQDKLARGGKIHHLLDIAFPKFYKDNSVWKLFPFTTPDEIKRIFEKQGVAGKYDFSSPLGEGRLT